MVELNQTSRPEYTAGEFEHDYARKSNVTVEWMRKRDFQVVSCDCDYLECRGWQMDRPDPGDCSKGDTGG